MGVNSSDKTPSDSSGSMVCIVVVVWIVVVLGVEQQVNSNSKTRSDSSSGLECIVIVVVIVVSIVVVSGVEIWYYSSKTCSSL